VLLTLLTTSTSVSLGARDWSDESSFAGSDAFSHDCGAWNSTILMAQGALLEAAAEPFKRAKIRYAIGPERWSSARIRLWQQASERQSSLPLHTSTHEATAACTAVSLLCEQLTPKKRRAKKRCAFCCAGERIPTHWQSSAGNVVVVLAASRRSSKRQWTMCMKVWTPARQPLARMLGGSFSAPPRPSWSLSAHQLRCLC
jgi:hypothetical protein